MANPKQIVAFSHESLMYGAPRSLLLALEAIRLKHRVTLVTPEDGGLVDAAHAMGINVSIVARTGVEGRAIAARARLLKRYVMLLRKLRPDVVYVNTVAHAAPVVAARIVGVPVVLHVREHPGYFEPSTLIGRRRLKTLMESPAQLLCVSDSVRQSVVGAGAEPDRVKVIYNGVDTEHFKPDPAVRQRIREATGWSDTTRVIGFVGQIQPRKGWQLLAEAFSLAAASQPDLRLLMVGADRGPQRRELEAWVKDSGLQQRIHLAPFSEDVRPYLNAMDLFVCPSEAEPFARVNLEAMAMRLPVLATAVGGNPEAVQEGQTGYLVPADDSRALAEQLERFAHSADRWRTLGAAGRARAERDLHVDYYCRGVEECLIRVAGAAHSTRASGGSGL